jgi:uncharacterized membrane protein YecN with MAPEG domain
MTSPIDMNPAQASALWSGLLILLLGLLSIRALLARRKQEGDPDNSETSELAAVAARAFGNGAEYIPVSIGTLILLYHLELPVMAIHALGGTLLAARLIQAIGLGASKSNTSRMAGVALTFIALFACGGMLVVHAFV